MNLLTDETETRPPPQNNNKLQPPRPTQPPPPPTTPAPPLARRRGMQCGGDLAPLRNRNGTPHRPPPPFPPSHRDASLPECRDGGVGSTRRFIRTPPARPRRDARGADTSLRSLSALFAPIPPAPGDRTALPPSSRALSRSPRTAGAVRPPCPTFRAPPASIRIRGAWFDHSTARLPALDTLRFARPRPRPPPAAGPPDVPILRPSCCRARSLLGLPDSDPTTAKTIHRAPPELRKKRTRTPEHTFSATNKSRFSCGRSPSDHD